ncbi:MAG: cytochrome P450, partial [Candidatus Competibacter sp.]|nr:cytochrome P450 [Candidatus Competibacter sp.]
QEINAKILFGRTLPYRAHPALLDAVNNVNDSLLRQVKRAMVLGGLPNRLPLPDARRFRRAVVLLHRTVDNLIGHAHVQEKSEDTLYASLIAAVAHRDRSPGDFHLRDQLITLFLAGHETTAVALAWTFYYLTEYPEWSDRLYNEIVEVLGDRAPTMADLDRLILTRRVVDESLRLRPPIYGIGRRARVEDEVGGYRIPAESPVIVSPYVMHHHPAYWNCPDRFDPDRFIPERATARPPSTYFPFGGGPHVCIGRHLATMELLAIVMLVVRAFRLTAPPARRVGLQPRITLRPQPGIPVRLARR